MKKNSVNKIENISLSAKQIKSKLEDAFAYDHSKYKDSDILFDSKTNPYQKLPFSDYKIAISEELANQQLLLENIKLYINEYKLIEENDNEEVFEEIEEETEEVVNDINILEEICEFDDEFDDDEEDDDEDDDEDLIEEYDEEEDDEEAKSPYDNRAKRPKGTTIKVVDVQAIILKIKREAIEKNKGKPVIGRRQINKMLKPYMIKRNNATDIEIPGIENSLTSIDIYLNAVNKIANTNKAPIHENSNVELNLKDILTDLEKK